MVQTGRQSSRALIRKKDAFTTRRAGRDQIELSLEVVNDESKCNPAFCYLKPQVPPEGESQRLVVALNRAVWPAAGALQRGDAAALKWLISLAILDRCATWRGNPILATLHRHLVTITLSRWLDYQVITWTAYQFRNHPMHDCVPDLVANAATTPQQITQFDVAVDSIRLAEFRQKMAQRFKKRPQAGSAESARGPDARQT
jgi:hypothetical protein